MNKQLIGDMLVALLSLGNLEITSREVKFTFLMPNYMDKIFTEQSAYLDKNLLNIFTKVKEVMNIRANCARGTFEQIEKDLKLLEKVKIEESIHD